MEHNMPKGYQWIWRHWWQWWQWWPWCKAKPVGGMVYIYDWYLFLGPLEIRKWSTRKIGVDVAGGSDRAINAHD